MNKLAFSIGGRPVTNDDLEVLQNLSLLVGGAMLLDVSTCVLSGCKVTAAGAAGRYNVAGGLVWLSQGVYQFDGVSNVELPGEFILGPLEVVDERVHQDGLTKPCITERKALLGVPDDVGTYTIMPDGPLMWYERVAALQRPLGLLEFGVFSLDDYDSTGLGKGRHRGWALADGRNGTFQMARRVPVGYDASDSDYSLGNIGGAAEVTLTVQQLPDHSHGYVDSVNVAAANNGSGQQTRATDPRTQNKTTSAVGGNQPHNNMPPFLVVAYRQWMGL